MKLIKVQNCGNLKILDIDNVSSIFSFEETLNWADPIEIKNITGIYLKQSNLINPDYIYIEASIEVVIEAIKEGLKEGCVYEN